MARTVGIGRQDFEKIRIKNNFYVDKTHFIKEWWEADDDVTLIARPRRFGKTLNMSMTEQFFSLKYSGRGELFEGLSIWEEEEYRKLQGTYPVISLTFANVKETGLEGAKKCICQILADLYDKNIFLLDKNLLTENEKAYFRSVTNNMEDTTAIWALHKLSDFLSRYYGKKVIILLDEYDTPMQEAYVNGYWDGLVSFIRSLFNTTFKTNPYFERAIMTGITGVSKESVFSDLNNLKVITTTSAEYEDCFGFTEKEVFQALDEFGLSDKKQDVKSWYDGFTFGQCTDIYNPWSIINYLDTEKFDTYWANTSSNGLIEKLIREGNKEVKKDFERLISGKMLTTVIDEQIVYNDLSVNRTAIWSLLLAGGYLKLDGKVSAEDGVCYYELALTNREVGIMFRKMIHDWFSGQDNYNDFIQALLQDDIDAMNTYMNKVTMETFSYFDTGKKSAEEEPERLPTGKATTKSLTEPNSSVCFYHGFVLGLMVELRGRYTLLSNRESGFGRYDVMLEPKRQEDDAVILEFKVFHPKKEKDLSDTVNTALKQIEDMNYEAALIARGIPAERIRKYGFAFRGKEVLIGKMK